jgi:dienelactone hydrolase
VDVARTRELNEARRARKAAAGLFAYAGADHGFLADTRPTCRPEDAKPAWTRTVEFLKKYLAG